MGTVKRERQKANRQSRLEELAKQARKNKTKRFSLRVALLIAAVVALVGVIYLLGSSDDSKSVSGVSTTVLDPGLPKPDVSIPAELPTELKVTTITEGSGEGAKVGDSMDVHYIGYLSADGTVFDNSYDSGSPFQLTLGAGMVIDGWDQGLVGLKTGGRYQLDIPATLGYGDTGSGDVIKPGDPISVIVDIMAITPGASPDTTTTTTTGA